ncbi:MAG: 4-hydroxythreonine-4-phosphate dehydrogenase PdxA [Bacteroidota bacterium]
MKEKNAPPKIGISIGDYNGIGPEVIIKALLNSSVLERLTPIIYSSLQVINYYKEQLKSDLQFEIIHSLDEAIGNKIYLYNAWNENVKIQPGIESKIAGQYAIKSLSMAVKHLKEERIDAITTAPLSKDLVQSTDFSFPGHTEYLTTQAGSQESLMFLVHESLRVGVVTGHIPLQKVSAAVTKEKVGKKLGIMLESLKTDFGKKNPRVAVLGLNPHAGEKGLLGYEEDETIAPTIKDFQESGYLVDGPMPSDGFFGQGDYKTYDGILAMYHDQGLIPFKTLAFAEGVNFTAGLPFIRTSPDHGTAFGIAGKSIADEISFKNALLLASRVAENRAI